MMSLRCIIRRCLRYARALPWCRANGHAVALMGLTQAIDCLGSNYLRSNDKFQLLFHSLQYETQSTWPGNGSYRVAGDRLTMSRNGASSETTLFSILRRPKPNGRYDQILRIVEPAKFGAAWGSATPATT
jgi:hypothetical protein